MFLIAPASVLVAASAPSPVASGVFPILLVAPIVLVAATTPSSHPEVALLFVTAILVVLVRPLVASVVVAVFALPFSIFVIAVLVTSLVTFLVPRGLHEAATRSIVASVVSSVLKHLLSILGFLRISSSALVVPLWLGRVKLVSRVFVCLFFGFVSLLFGLVLAFLASKLLLNVFLRLLSI